MRSAQWRAGSRRLATPFPLLAAAVWLAMLASPAAVSAHALLRSADPAPGSTLGSPPAAVTITFTERPDIGLTSIKVLDASGRDLTAGAAVAVDDPPLSARVPLGPMGDGVYTVSWRVVSAVDGHISAGSFVFGVGQPPPSAPPDDPGAGSSVSGSPPAIGARWILYLGLTVLFGAAWIALAVARRPVPDLLAMAAAGWVLTAIGSFAVVAVQWAEIGAPLETLPSTSIGLSALLRGVSLTVVGFALAALALLPRFGGRRGWAAVAVSAAVAMAIDVGTGHAAAGPAWIWQVIVQTLHAAGAAAWIGGLAGLLLVVRTTPSDDRLPTARRFSSWAGVALAVVVVTGTVRAIAEIGTLEALVGTDFGRVVLAKSGLLLVLAGFGAFNRYFTLRSAARVASALGRVGAAELGIAVVILGLSAMLVTLSPPSSDSGPPAPAPEPITAYGHDFGTSVRARLVVTPGAASSNVFDLVLADYDSGEPVDASAVELRFALASLSGVGESTLDLSRGEAGRFSGSGPNLSIDGIWTVNAIVTVPGSAVTVPLVLATQVAAQPAEQLVSPGLPTIYQVRLGAIGMAQVYLDPGGPGQTELHVTFFDAAGNEQPINSATIATFPTGAAGELAIERMLQPGHFVATIDAVAGPLTVDVVTPLPTGSGAGQIHLHVTIEVTP